MTDRPLTQGQDDAVEWRDIKIRYRQTLLGILWAVIQPVLTMVVFTILFGRLVAALNVRYGVQAAR